MMELGACRLWWPKQLLSCKSSTGFVIFGWYMQSVSSIDIIVAAAVSSCVTSFPRPNLQEILHHANRKAPMALQEFSTFQILGHCAAIGSKISLKTTSQECSPFPNGNSELLPLHGISEIALEKASVLQNLNNQSNEASAEAALAGNCGRYKCGCENLDMDMENHRQSALRSGTWMQFVQKSQNLFSEGDSWVPELHHLHLNGFLLQFHDIHLIIYKPPTYGHHHFSLIPWSSSELPRTPPSSPLWLMMIHKKPLLMDVGKVVLALNCTSVLNELLEEFLDDPKSQSTSMLSLTFGRSVPVVWSIVAAIVASVASAVYLILQQLRWFLHNLYGSLFYMLFRNVFVNTRMNVHIRCCQFLYWPVILQSYGFSSQSSVEYAHRAALQKHHFWSNMVVDLVLGNLIGVSLFIKAEAVAFEIMFVVRFITNNLLRSGFVWLMGVPAGFKLNTELAKLLGIVSLNAIQVFSALWCVMGSYLESFIKGLGLLGVIFGLTVLSALCKDILKLATLHIFILHWMISYMYSRQIQTLAALWRLFRGRKWNPLRQRLDSYDYNVEQHIVGSLLFTPVLLLLPTTSVFYVFFTMLSTSISFLCIIIEILVSALHATPYCEVFLWMGRRCRFPSGIWFEFKSPPSPNVSDDLVSSHKGSQQRDVGSGGATISVLHSNYATFSQVVMPIYRNIFSSVSQPLVATMHGILGGQRMPSSMGTALPPTMPWMQICTKDYWKLCYDSVLRNPRY